MSGSVDGKKIKDEDNEVRIGECQRSIFVMTDGDGDGVLRLSGLSLDLNV